MTKYLSRRHFKYGMERRPNFFPSPTLELSPTQEYVLTRMVQMGKMSGYELATIAGPDVPIASELTQMGFIDYSPFELRWHVTRFGLNFLSHGLENASE